METDMNFDVCYRNIGSLYVITLVYYELGRMYLLATPSIANRLTII